MHFDAQGRQTSRVDRLGNATTFTYDGSSDRVLTSTDPVGLVTTLAYGPDNKLGTITDPTNRVTTFDHDIEGNLLSITDPDTTQRLFTYDTRHRLTTQTSKRGFVSSYEYGGAGRNVNAIRPDGSTRAVSSSQTVGVVDPASGVGTSTNPLPVIRPDEVTATFTDGNGKVSPFSTDKYGATTLRTDPLNRVTQIIRNIHGQPLITTTSNGAIARRTYDTQGNVLAFVEAEGQPEERTTSFEYDATFNRVKKITDPELKVTTIAIDPANGNVTKITNPLLDDREFTYETTAPLTGLVKTVTDENGKTTTFTYDAKGNVDTSTDPEGNVTQFTRDAAGNVLTRTEGVGTPEVRTRIFTYDVLNHLTSATDGTANPPTQFRYDAEGNLEDTERPTGEITQRTYDEANRVITIADPRQGTSTFTYDLNGNLKTATNALNDTSLFDYDDANQLTKITDALTGEQVFAYDVAGNVEMFTDARSKTTTFDYDLLNRQVLRTNPLNQVTTFTYDSRNNLETITDPKSQFISRVYDDLSRLTQLTTPDNIITVTYDAASNPLTVGDTDSLVTFAYDGLNRALTAATTDLGAQPAITLTNTYNAVGNRTSLEDILSSTTTYQYDLAGRLKQLTMPALLDIFLTYDLAGRLDTIAFPNGVVSDYGYDTQGRLNTLTHTLGGNPSVVDFGYTYNPVGNIESIINNITSSQTRTFTYDALQRLKMGGMPAAQEDYDYDLTGNRTTSFISPINHTHNDANRLVADDQYTYTYDLNGNLETKIEIASGDLTTYTWDAQNQLIQIGFPNLTTATYKYDGFGRRIEKNVNGAITRYVYDSQNIFLEYDGTNIFVSRYSHGKGVDQPLGVQRAGVGFFYYHANHQGSIITLTDSSGLVANSYFYDSYGRSFAVSEIVPQPYTYTGREFDQESGLYYYRARYYDPHTGRFASEDPIRFEGDDQNLYRYVVNNPVNLTDPLGLIPPKNIQNFGGKCIVTDFECFQDCIDIMKDACDPDSQLKCDLNRDPTSCARCGGSAFDLLVAAVCFAQCSEVKEGCECE